MLHLLLVPALTVVPPQQAPAPSPVARVVVSPAETALVVGDTLRLTAQALDSAGRPVPEAQVRFFVNVVALVKDQRPSRPAVDTIRIGSPPPARVVIRPGATRLVPGQRVLLSAEVVASNGDLREDPVSWASSAPAVLRVGADGQLEAVAPGRATVTASSGSQRATATLTVVPNTVRRLEIVGGASEARTGDVLHLRAVARDASGREVTGLSPLWTMAPGRGLIGQDGAFVADEPGEYTITTSLGTVSAVAVVRVRARDVRRASRTVGRLPVKGLLTAEFWPHPNGRNAYLSTVGDRLYALDIADPATPVVTDSVLVDARHINDVMATADGRWAVMTRENASSRRNGIVILDLADPAHPKVASEYTETVTGGVHSAFVYVARWQTRPDQAGNYLHDLDIQDGLAYLAYWNDGLVILDVGNGMRGGSPTNPQLVSQLKYDLDALYARVEAEGGPGFIRGTHTAWRHKNYVFVGDEVFSATPQGLTVPGLGLGRANGRLHVVDVSDITQPRMVAWYEPRDGGVHNVWVAGDTLYLGDYQGGLRVLDISGELRGDLEAQGREVAWVHTGDARGQVPNAAMAWGAFYHKGLVWVNDMFSGLWVVRLEPRGQPMIP
ncbi:MAG: Ig-like domain-containing protein [Gemmatimonadetes bacterium]|nr:Ig-like domain-containing protein [Gemmatimonadota bacterium]